MSKIVPVVSHTLAIKVQREYHSRIEEILEEYLGVEENKKSFMLQFLGMGSESV